MSAPQDPADLNALLRAARTGSRSALDALLRALGPWIRLKASRILRRTPAPIGVSTLTQETKLRLSRSITRVRAIQSPQVKALIKRIATNTARSAQRGEMRIKRTRVDWDPRLSPEGTEDPFDALLDTRRRERLLAALCRLPPRQEQAMRALLDGSSIEQIAEALETTPKNIYNLLDRAKATLRAALTED